MSVRALAVMGALAVALPGCGQSSYKVGNNIAESGGAAGIDAAGSANVSGGTAGSAGRPSTCEAPEPGPAPLSRLTSSELANTVRALLGSSDIDAGLAPDADGYEQSPEVEVSADTIERLHRVAHLRAKRIASQPAELHQLTGCDVLESGEAACKAQLYERFVARAFRRPLTSADRADLDAVFADGKALGGSFAHGARAVIEVTLQSPELLYLVAEGDGRSEGGLVPLTSHETASRLAYFLTGAPPDDHLWQAASQGPLDDAAIATHARRLLGGTASRQRVREFFERRFRLGSIEASPDAGYSRELAELTREAGLRFVEDVVFDGEGTFRALMSSPTAFMNADLAAFYDVPGVTGADLSRVMLDPSQRRGLLTQPALLRASSPGDFTRPVLRGIQVLKEVLCVELPAPPSSIPPLPEPTGAVLTTRERFASTTSAPACASCHALINPPGLAFESYDAFGRYRTHESGAPIDPSGTLITTDAGGYFRNAIELIDHIASSADAERCFQKRWLREAYRRTLESADECELDRIAAEALGERTITDLLVTVAQSANLKYRPKTE